MDISLILLIALFGIIASIQLGQFLAKQAYKKVLHNQLDCIIEEVQNIDTNEFSEKELVLIQVQYRREVERIKAIYKSL